METECWNKNKTINGEIENWLVVMCFLKNEILVVGEIEILDVKKIGNGNVIDGEDGVFQKK